MSEKFYQDIAKIAEAIADGINTKHHYSMRLANPSIAEQVINLLF